MRRHNAHNGMHLLEHDDMTLAHVILLQVLIDIVNQSGKAGPPHLKVPCGNAVAFLTHLPGTPRPRLAGQIVYRDRELAEEGQAGMHSRGCPDDCMSTRETRIGVAHKALNGDLDGSRPK